MPKNDPYEAIRVRDKDTGYHLTIYRMNLAHGNYQELKQDAVEPNTGEFLPPDTAPADGPSAASSKEN